MPDGKHLESRRRAATSGEHPFLRGLDWGNPCPMPIHFEQPSVEAAYATRRQDTAPLAALLAALEQAGGSLSSSSSTRRPCCRRRRRLAANPGSNTQPHLESRRRKLGILPPTCAGRPSWPLRMCGAASGWHASACCGEWATASMAARQGGRRRRQHRRQRSFVDLRCCMPQGRLQCNTEVCTCCLATGCCGWPGSTTGWRAALPADG